MTEYTRLILVGSFLISFLTNGHAQKDAADLELMPMPVKIIFTGEKLRLDDSFKIAIMGTADKNLYSYATRVLRRLSGRTGLFFPQDFLTLGEAVDSAMFIVKSKAVADLQLGVDESYSISINASGVELVSENSIGAMRGLETFLQLLSVDDSGYYFPGVKIEDKPRFQWRGLMIDASRHFMPIDVIKRNLDGMAAVKLNVFHWHLCDDQGFRVESKVYPNLHLKGSDGLYYSQNQVIEIIEYAAERGIRVVPEFDVPGHATSWVVAYPKLGSGIQPDRIERKWGIFYQALNPASEYTYTFLDTLFGEMSKLFPDKYFHIGGDELEHGDYHEAKHWNENKDIQTFMEKNGIKDNSALQAYFNSRLLESLTKYGKVLIGWDEILHENMPTNIVIQSWRGKESMEQAARMGYQSILSNGYYIDLIYPTRDHYINDPIPEDINLTSEQKKLILGGEATMWAEFISPETIDSRIWPRTAAIAERFWSPQSVNDLDDMYRRLDIISFQLEEHGLTHIKNYEMMLRRLTGNQDIQPLKVLVDVIEPLKHYNRGRGRVYSSYSPLSRVVDAARPESMIARQFDNLVNQYLASKKSQSSNAEQIKSQLELWKNNHQKVLPLIGSSPVLKEIEPSSYNLSKVAELALIAIQKLELNQKLDLNQDDVSIIKEARKSYGQTELIIVPSIIKLLNAVSKSEIQWAE